jgi:hypothetical protein
MKTTIYIAVRGGVVQGVRLGKVLGRDNREPDSTECFVVDYDNYGHDNANHADEEAFERSVLDGRTWEEISATSEGVW